MFELGIDHHARVITIKMTGWFDKDTAVACASAKEQAVQRLGPPFADHCTLLDITEFRLHPQEIFAIFTDFVMHTRYKSRRIGIVGGDGTARMQFRRVAEQKGLYQDIRMFADSRSARRWLMLNETDQRAA